MSTYCCEDMQLAVERRCEQHPNPFDCPDKLITYLSKFDEFGIIIHDGGGSFAQISFCPWCGSRLPESRRDRWFEELESQGLDPDSDSLPARYLTDEWYRAQ